MEIGVLKLCAKAPQGATANPQELCGIFKNFEGNTATLTICWI